MRAYGSITPSLGCHPGENILLQMLNCCAGGLPGAEAAARGGVLVLARQAKAAGGAAAAEPAGTHFNFRQQPLQCLQVCTLWRSSSRGQYIASA